MYMKIALAAVLLLQLRFLLGTHNFQFDIDELTSRVYDLSIYDIPILNNVVLENEALSTDYASVGDLLQTPQIVQNSKHVENLVIGNKRGRSYYCSIPRPATEAELKKAADYRQQLLNNLTSAEVENVLDKFLSHCLRKNVGWWTYEFCNNNAQVNQFHVEQIGQKADDDHKISLGKLDFLQQWNISAQNVSYVQRKQPLYYVRQYADGSICELTSKPRKTEIRFYCDEDLFGSELRAVEEDESCAYIMHVYTKGLCLIEAFVPENVQSVSNEIACKPTVNAKEMNAYQKKQEEMRIKSTAESKNKQMFDVDSLPVDSIHGKHLDFEISKNPILQYGQIANRFKGTIESLLKKISENLESLRDTSQAETFQTYIEEIVKKEKQRKKNIEPDDEDTASLKDLGLTFSKTFERFEREIDKAAQAATKISSVEPIAEQTTSIDKKGRRKKSEAFLIDTAFSIDGDLDENAIKKQTDKLEQQITSKLENKFSNADGKIKVEIATAYYDSKKKKYHVIKSGSLDSLGGLVSNLLGGRAERHEEDERFSAMKQNYDFDVENED